MKARVPFVGPAYAYPDSPIAVQELVNYYLEVVSNQGRDPVALRGYPGLVSFTTGLAGRVRGMGTFDGITYVVAGTTLYTIASDGTATSRGTINGTGRIKMIQNPTQILICDKPIGHLNAFAVFPGNTTEAYVYTKVSNTLTLIADVDFSAANDRGFFWSQETDDFLLYDALDTAQAGANGDKVVGCLTDDRQLVIFGEVSTEFWYFTGDTIPFSRQDGAVISYGCIAPDSITRGADTFFWLGHDKSVYSASAFSPVKISNYAIDDAIQTYANPENAVGFYHTWKGHKFYTLSFDEATWVYDVDLGPEIGWSKRKSWNIDRWRGTEATFNYGKQLIGDHYTGTIWEMRSDIYDEGGEILEAKRTGNYYHNNQNTFWLTEFELIMQVGRGLIIGQGSDPKVMLRITKDGGRTWGPERQRSLGVQGANDTRVRFTRNGKSNTSMAVEIRITDPVPRDIISAVGNIKVGAGWST